MKNNVDLIKTPEQIEKIRVAAGIWKKVREAILSSAKVGVSLKELDELARKIILENNAEPAFYNYQGFPGNICISVNECVIHGVPTNYTLKDDDIVSFDIGVKYDGAFCDAAFTTVVGKASAKNIELDNVCRQSLYKAISVLRDGASTRMVAEAVQDYVESRGFEVLRDFTGHGCGNQIHEDPAIPNYRTHLMPSAILKSGMVICIEPMVMTKSHRYKIDPTNGWSVLAQNKKNTAHWEHMLLITDDGCEILTE